MAEFTPITSQEDFDAAIAARLQRERASAVKPYADYDTIKNNLATATKTLAERDATIADLTGQLKSSRSDLAKTRVALAKGLPAELAGRLTGETDEELQKDADTLLALIGRHNPSSAEPSKATEPAGKGGKGASDAWGAVSAQITNLF